MHHEAEQERADPARVLAARLEEIERERLEAQAALEQRRSELAARRAALRVHPAQCRAAWHAADTLRRGMHTQSFTAEYRPHAVPPYAPCRDGVSESSYSGIFFSSSSEMRSTLSIVNP